MTKSGPL